MPDNHDDFRRLGHKRPWWNFNLLTLFGILFALVWIRFLFDLRQEATIAFTLIAILSWIMLGAFGQPPREPRPGIAQQWGNSPRVADNWRAPRAPPPPPWHVPLHVKNLGEVPAFTTKDGSEIRELLAFRNSCIRWQSLAEARLPPGAATTPHYHPQTEEIYYIVSGTGSMRLERAEQTVGPGDAIAIPPGTRHQITNTGDETLTFLCCCVPAYEHEDTVLVDDWPNQPSTAGAPDDPFVDS